MMIRSWRLQHARLAAPTADAHGLRRASTASAPRVLCSVADLLEMRGRALKFPLRATPLHSPPPLTPQPSPQTQPPPAKARARRSQALATGFVFFCEETRQVRAFVNSCPHARLELDLDDSDFFCEGFLQCKAHGAFFDPQTGMCLQGPTGQRAGQTQKTIPGLPVLDVCVDDSGNVILVESGNDQQQQQRASTHTGHLSATSTPSSSVDDEGLSAYRTKRQRELAMALSSRADDVHAIQKALHEKTMARIQKYKQQQQVPRTPKGSN